MPPKSAKKEKTVWWKCEKCQTSVLASELTKHQSDECQREALAGYVTDGLFVSSRFECGKFGAFDELKDVSEVQSSGLILFGSSVMSKLGLVLGDLVEVTVGNFGSVVRKVWPIDEKHGARVISVHIDEVTVPEHVQVTVSIKPFLQTVTSVNELELRLIEEGETDHVTKNERTFLKLLRRQYLGRIMNYQNLLHLRLCNKIIAFKTTKVCLRNIQNLPIDEQLGNLRLGSQYYHIDRDSIFSIDLAMEKKRQIHQKTFFNLDNIGGLDSVINDIKDIANIALGVTKSTRSASISRGILVYGVSGAGKTLLVNSIAEYFKCQTIRINCTEIFSKFYGESESNISKLFVKALNSYPSPTIVIVEEIHNLCPKAEGSDIVKRISQFFVNLLDSLHTSLKGGRTLVIGTTDNLDNLNPSIRRSGRMDYEFEIPVPGADARMEILSKIMSSYKHGMLAEEIKAIARVTHGYVGADLVSLVGRAAHDSHSTITYTSMTAALQHVKASAMREIMIECPNVHWTDIGGQDDLKLKLRQIIEWPIHRPEIFTRLGIAPPRGLLMFGPPGCSKTMIAKAIATESKVNFLSIKGSELFSMWVGESERAVRELFRKARQVAPSIIFFDEIDAIGGERSADSGSSVKERVLAQILTEIDGVSVLKNVKIIAATNRPDMIDKALMRPGRLDRIIYVRLPDSRTRQEIFRIKLARIPTAADVCVEDLVSRTEGYSGSEIEAICQEAVLKALEESFDTLEISRIFFDFALQTVKPRTSPELLKLYESYLKQQQQG